MHLENLSNEVQSHHPIIEVFQDRKLIGIPMLKNETFYQAILSNLFPAPCQKYYRQAILSILALYPSKDIDTCQSQMQATH